MGGIVYIGNDVDCCFGTECNSVNERDLNLLISDANLVATPVDSWAHFLEGLSASLADGSLRQKQVKLENSLCFSSQACKSGTKVLS